MRPADLDDSIIYKGKCELDAIAAWSLDHANAIGLLRNIFLPDAKAGEDRWQTTFKDELYSQRKQLEEPDFLRNLDPESRWKDAKAYMAQLLCYVWSNLDACNSNAKAADYVFRIAREGGRLYADCRYARVLIQKYGKQTSTVVKEAKILHATGTHFKKAKWRGIEKPPTVAQMARKSKAEEERQITKAMKIV